MNQRIQELALEAFQPINDITTEGVADRNTFDQAWFKLYNKKYAELIVRECIDIVGVGGEFASRPKLVEKLQEHFGVEE